MAERRVLLAVADQSRPVLLDDVLDEPAPRRPLRAPAFPEQAEVVSLVLLLVDLATLETQDGASTLPTASADLIVMSIRSDPL